MDEWTKLFDSLLLNVAAYVVTMWNLLFHPLRVFQQVDTQRTCSASLTYLFTVLLCYVYLKVVSSARTKSPEWLTPNNVVVFGIVYVAGIVNIQQYAVARIINEAVNVPLKDQLWALVYAFCPVLFLSVAVGAAGFLQEISKAFYPAVIALQAVYLFSLFNVSRGAFRLSLGRALLCAFAAWACFFGLVVVVTIAFFSFLWLRDLAKSR